MNYAGSSDEEEEIQVLSEPRRRIVRKRSLAFSNSDGDRVDEQEQERIVPDNGIQKSDARKKPRTTTSQNNETQATLPLASTSKASVSAFASTAAAVSTPPASTSTAKVAQRTSTARQRQPPPPPIQTVQPPVTLPPPQGQPDVQQAGDNWIPLLSETSFKSVVGFVKKTFKLPK